MLEKYIDWAISSRTPNRSGFNDYPGSGGRGKRLGTGSPKPQMWHGEDIVCSLQKYKVARNGAGTDQRSVIYANVCERGDVMSEKSWKVYVHTNRTNGKRYVGVTSKQKVEHRWNSGRGYKQNPHFYAAIEKYGWDNFDHTVLYDVLTEQQAKDMECALIKQWDTMNVKFGYNMTSGGDGTVGCIPSLETREKLSRARMRENLSEETLRRRSEALKGRRFQDEHKRKIGEGNSKPINMFSKDGSFIRSFSSAREAEVELGISHSHISQCCNNKRSTTGGYVWKFA